LHVEQIFTLYLFDLADVRAIFPDDVDENELELDLFAFSHSSH